MNLTVYFTNQCNLECKYCYEEHKQLNTNMNIDTIDNMIIFIEKECLKSDKEFVVQMKIHGGEPLLNYKNIRYMLNKIKENSIFSNNISYEITTNLTVLNEEIIDIMSQMSRIYVSIDGDNISHDKNRVFKNNEGSYDVVVKNIKILLKYRPDLVARVTISKNTKDRFIHNVLDIYRIGIKEITCELNFKEKWNYEELLEMFEYNKELNNILEKEELSDLYYANLENPLRLNANSLCNGGINEFSINFNGDIYPCIYAIGIDKFKLGNINSPDKKLKKLNEKYYKSSARSECIDCSHLEICDSNRCLLINEIKTGSVSEPWNYFCTRQNFNNLLYKIKKNNNHI